MTCSADEHDFTRAPSCRRNASPYSSSVEKEHAMSLKVRLLRPALALAALTALAALGGCVAYPAGAYPYGGAVYAPAPTVVVPVRPYYYGGYYGGYHRGWEHGGWGHDR
jgi:hypothetical protein